MPVLPTLTKDSTLADVRNAQVDAARTLIELRSVAKDKRGDTHAADLREVADFILEGDIIEKAYAAGERAARAQEDADLAAQGKVRGPRGHVVDLQASEFRSLGAQAVENADFEAWAKAGGRGGRGAFAIEVRNLIGGYTTGAYDSGADGVLPVGSPVMVPGSMQRRRMFVRDLASVQTTGLRVVPYVRETNQVTNETGAQMTSEGSAKAEVTMQFENYSAIVEKITAWIPATDEILVDAPTLKGYIDTRLEYMLDLREEQQELHGTGTSPQLQGLSTLNGTQFLPSVSGDYPAAIGRAAALVENVDGDADGVITNPLDYWTAVTTRYANQFDNGFGGGAPGNASGITWGLPVVRTRAQTTGTAWVGAFRLGMTVFDRQQTTVKVGDQHSDYLIRNLLVILAERRVAVAWHRPNLFVEVTVPAGTPAA